MKNRLTTLRIMLLATAVAAVGTSEMALAQTEAQSENQDTNAAGQTGFADIIITARRRDESLQQVPIAVTALGGADLEQRSTRDIRDLSSIAPNLQVGGSNYGSTYAVVNLRGQDNANQRGSYDPAVGIYFDEVYLGRSSGALLSSLVDMQSVQILRGPQATLFGRNNTGGAILLTPNRPNLSGFGGSASINYGNYDHFELGGTIDATIVDGKLGIRGSYLRTRQDGTGRSVTTGNDSYGNRHRDSGRIALRWMPSDTVTFDINYDFSRIDETGGLWVNVLQQGPGFYSTRAGMVDPRAYAKIDGVTFRSEIELSSEATLKAIVGRRVMKTINQTDVEGLPVNAVDQFSFANQNQWTGELQLSGTVLKDAAPWLSALDYTGGVYYFWEEGFDGSQYPIAPVPLLFGPGSTATGRNTNRSTAAYLQLETNHWDKLFLTAGVRYTVDNRSLTLQNTVNSACSIQAFPAGTPVDLCKQTGGARFDYWSWSLGARYQFSPDANIYVKADRGQRSGGLGTTPLTIIPFDPEIVTNVEAGFKLSLFDHKVRFNAAAFHDKYKNIQRASRLISSNGVIYQSVFNAAAGRIQGLEIELSANPIPGLTLTGALGLLDAKYTDFIDPRPGPTNGSDVSALRFPSTPKTSYSLSASYDIGLGDFGRITPRADFSYRSRQTFDVYNAPIAEQAGYGLLNARVSLVPAQFLDGSAEIAFYARNITKRRYEDYALVVTNVVQRNDSPRMYGVELKARF